MQISGKGDPEGPLITTQFYYSQTFPYLIEKWHQEILRRLKEVPEAFRQRELAPNLKPWVRRAAMLHGKSFETT
jgi:hypothetical protein